MLWYDSFLWMIREAAGRAGLELTWWPRFPSLPNPTSHFKYIFVCYSDHMPSGYQTRSWTVKYHFVKLAKLHETIVDSFKCNQISVYVALTKCAISEKFADAGSLSDPGTEQPKDQLWLLMNDMPTWCNRHLVYLNGSCCRLFMTQRYQWQVGRRRRVISNWAGLHETNF